MSRLAVLLALVLTARGCGDVLSPRPMGETDVLLVPEEWDGVWFFDGEEFSIFKVAEPDRKSLQVWSLETDSSGTPSLEPTEFILRESGGWLFLSMPNNPGDFYWGRAKKDGDTLLVWQPDDEKFAKLVEQGILPGVSESNGVMLGELDASHYAIITSEAHGVLFHWDQPLIFQRARR